MGEWFRRLRVLLVLLAASGGAHATYHLWTITQLYSNADGSVQFVELRANAAGQQFLRGHTLVSAQGGTTHAFTFPADLPGDTATTTDGGYYGGGIMEVKSMVVGTQGFAALGIVTPDYVVPNGFLFTSGGTLNYAEGADTWTYPALPTDGSRALNRNGSTGVNAPMNFAGESGTVSATNLPGALSGLWWNAGESGWGIALHPAAQHRLRRVVHLRCDGQSQVVCRLELHHSGGGHRHLRRFALRGQRADLFRHGVQPGARQRGGCRDAADRIPGQQLGIDDLHGLGADSHRRDHAPARGLRERDARDRLHRPVVERRRVGLGPGDRAAGGQHVPRLVRRMTAPASRCGTWRPTA